MKSPALSRSLPFWRDDTRPGANPVQRPRAGATPLHPPSQGDGSRSQKSRLTNNAHIGANYCNRLSANQTALATTTNTKTGITVESMVASYTRIMGRDRVRGNAIGRLDNARTLA